MEEIQDFEGNDNFISLYVLVFKCKILSPQISILCSYRKLTNKVYFMWNMRKPLEWNYDELQQLLKSTGTSRLFTSMMNTFRNRMVVVIQKIYILKNSWKDIKLWFLDIVFLGLPSLAKPMLNFFWWKFRQEENKSTTGINNQPSELFEMLSNQSYIVIS